jgi:hypothetical protein
MGVETACGGTIGGARGFGVGAGTATGGAADGGGFSSMETDCACAGVARASTSANALNAQCSDRKLTACTPASPTFYRRSAGAGEALDE